MANPLSTRAGRSYRILAVGIVLAAVIVSATIFVTYTSVTTVTRTTTSTTTEFTTFLVSESTRASASSNGTRVFQATFQQVRYCGQYNILPWAVTLNGFTEVQPSNQSFPLPTNTFSTFVPDQNLTRITFSLPDGTYNYAVWGGTPHGPGGQLYPEGGTVEINGSNVLVNLAVYLSYTCTSTSASQS